VKVEFEHRHLEPGSLQVTVGSKPVPASLARQLAGRLRLTQWAVLVCGAAAVAFATERAGVSLSGALCIFAGALPVLWVVGGLGGALLHLRRTARQVSSQLGSTAWQREVEAATRRERMTFEVLETGLQVTREGRAPSLVGYQRVGMQRLGGEQLMVNVDGEAFHVPLTAFAGPGEFDAFCLGLQARVWATQHTTHR
jgi:hypothetical protein